MSEDQTVAEAIEAGDVTAAEVAQAPIEDLTEDAADAA